MSQRASPQAEPTNTTDTTKTSDTMAPKQARKVQVSYGTSTKPSNSGSATDGRGSLSPTVRPKGVVLHQGGGPTPKDDLRSTAYENEKVHR